MIRIVCCALILPPHMHSFICEIAAIMALLTWTAFREAQRPPSTAPARQRSQELLLPDLAPQLAAAQL